MLGGWGWGGGALGSGGGRERRRGASCCLSKVPFNSLRPPFLSLFLSLSLKCATSQPRRAREKKSEETRKKKKTKTVAAAGMVGFFGGKKNVANGKRRGRREKTVQKKTKTSGDEESAFFLCLKPSGACALPTAGPRTGPRPCRQRRRRRCPCWEGWPAARRGPGTRPRAPPRPRSP